LIPELEFRGHRTVAVDMPSDDPDATFEDYADVVVAALDVTGDAGDIVAVGHSLGGYVLPWMAQRVPLCHLVFLGALVGESGRSLIDQNREHQFLNPVYPSGLSKVDGGTRWVDVDLARSLFYQDCDDDVVAAAIPRLRIQASGLLRQPCALGGPAGADSTYIVCADDQMVHPAWSRRVAREWLGAAVVELPAGHSPFYSHPSDLADVLDALA
jgi:pimeloyl-ACP methyl ester carboxylesterase